MGRHGTVILRRVDKPVPKTVAPTSSRVLSLSTRQLSPALTMGSPSTPNNGAAPMPPNWSLWRPDNGIVFGASNGVSTVVTASGTATTAAATATVTATAPVSETTQTQTKSSAAATASVSTTPRKLVPRVAASPLAQQSPRRAVAFAQQATTHFVHTTMPIRFSPKQAIHSMAQRADVFEDKLSRETFGDTKNGTRTKEQTGARETVTTETEKAAEAAEATEAAAAPETSPETNLDYKVPDDLFRAARVAPEGSPESYWSYALYRNIQTDKKGDDKADNSDDAATNAAKKSPTTVKVHYCKSKLTTERVCQEYFLDEPLLGFDLEWMPNATRWDSARRNVCLVQLASPSRIGLFHLSLYPAKDDLMAPKLRRILEDASSIKAGVCIRGDATRMRKFLNVDMRGVVELSHLHKLVTYSKSGETSLINKKLVSLSSQVQQHLRLPMFKGQDVRASDWSKPLQMDQIIFQIFSVLEMQRESLDPKPPRPAFAELNLPIKLAGGVVASPAAAEETSEEAADDLAEEPAVDGDVGVSPAQLSAEYLDKAKTTIEFEAEEDKPATPATPGKTRTASAPSLSDTPKTSKTPKSPRLPKSPATPSKTKDARIVAAEEWIARYRATASSNGRTVRARPASLRAYHLWHGNDELDPVTLAALLRDPPLQTNTVVSYILDAVQLEALPYVKTRLRDELLEHMPRDFLMKKYSGLARSSGYTVGPASASASTGFRKT
ncbi:3 -5 exonuclease helicase [Sporothrix brasiliensis 5110]|uniref:3-5 exonuclease helicase n=1 Tax=Sporothrix brasiliensis 5110 TaxID=1398154 RepID=A0A0C2EPW1_9PEZI|nr:3 -5 exonuclease helicase [Sporothrix brasiliensis 5110]KIH88339.1 3 -5 exonuclease helicase [Sporothrix brasiliensis 5110]